MPRRTPHVNLLLVFGCLFALMLPTVATAQPFGSWTLWDRPQTGYFQIPHDSDLNPTAQITIEGWVDLEDAGTGGCSNIVGKGFTTAWWVGICGDQLRSYLRGPAGTSVRTAGDIGQTGWHHFAVTYDGSERCHYVDGREAECWAHTGSLATNSQPVRIGSDVDFNNATPEGAINEIRLWNVARTVQQIRDTINEPLDSPEPGLVAVWSFGSGVEALGEHPGSLVGNVPALTFPVTALPCSNTATTLCLHDRFNVTIRWETASSSGVGSLTPLVSTQSGVFWFFNPTNWEVLVKVLNGCGVSGNWWVFTAATTNVFYRMEVFDQEAGYNKVYFNYAGPPAPAVTDTSALPTCP
ncbi:MAG TPA: LamG domain-containing protein [Thermoanaerobaculia bacterium]|nr:LamG domain-containing protein [Thermoanaerobaculia bacterium]